MQVASTVWQGRISPLFDSKRKLLVAQIEDNRIVATHVEASTFWAFFPKRISTVPIWQPKT